MLKSVPGSLAAWRSLSKMALVVMFLVVALISFLMPVFRLVIFFMESGVIVDTFRILGQVRRPPIGGTLL
jgi:hypothetical protein